MIIRVLSTFSSSFNWKAKRNFRAIWKTSIPKREKKAKTALYDQMYYNLYISPVCHSTKLPGLNKSEVMENEI